MTAIRTFEMLVTTHPTQPHIPEDRNPRQCCENLESHVRRPQTKTLELTQNSYNRKVVTSATDRMRHNEQQNDFHETYDKL